MLGSIRNELIQKVGGKNVVFVQHCLDLGVIGGGVDRVGGDGNSSDGLRMRDVF